MRDDGSDGGVVRGADRAVAGGAREADRTAGRTLERVVLGIDFGPASLGAARWLAGQLHARTAAGASPPGLDACLAHVLPGDDGPTDADAAGHGLQAVRPAVLGGLAGFAASLRLERARPVLRVGRPAAELARLVASDAASLLVLGRRRDAARQRVGEPNVIERVIRRAPSDVLVVPEGAAGATRHVLAGVDAGPTARDVVARAARLAEALGATLTLVHVLAPFAGAYERLRRGRPRAPGAPLVGAVDAAADRDAADLEDARRDAAYGWLLGLAGSGGAHAPVPSRLAVAVGDAGRELAELAERDGPAVVVVGKRGADDAPPGSLGSVARELVTRAPAPVLVVEGGGRGTGAG